MRERRTRWVVFRQLNGSDGYAASYDRFARHDTAAASSFVDGAPSLAPSPETSVPAPIAEPAPEPT